MFKFFLGIINRIFQILFLFITNPNKVIFFCFDDWGCHQDEVPESFLSWLPNASRTYKFQAQKVSTTRFTRYYKIIFN